MHSIISSQNKYGFNLSDNLYYVSVLDVVRSVTKNLLP